MAGRLVAERDGKVRVARYQSALTYHFGPPLAAAAWPVSLPARLRQPARPGQALAAVGGGFPIAMVVLGAALEAHWLCGPTLLGGGGLAAGEVGLAGAGQRGDGGWPSQSVTPIWAQRVAVDSALGSLATLSRRSARRSFRSVALCRPGSGPGGAYRGRGAGMGSRSAGRPRRVPHGRACRQTV